MRTPVELTDDQRLALTAIASMRGLHDISSLVQEAIDRYLAEEVIDWTPYWPSVGRWRPMRPCSSSEGSAMPGPRGRPGPTPPRGLRKRTRRKRHPIHGHRGERRAQGCSGATAPCAAGSVRRER